MKITASLKQIASLIAFVLLSFGLPVALAESANAACAGTNFSLFSRATWPGTNGSAIAGFDGELCSSASNNSYLALQVTSGYWTGNLTWGACSNISGQANYASASSSPGAGSTRMRALGNTYIAVRMCGGNLNITGFPSITGASGSVEIKLVSISGTGTATDTNMYTTNPMSNSPLTITTAAINVIAGAASATTSTVSVSTASITANGTSTSTITAQLKDAYSNSLTSGGATVTFVSPSLGSIGSTTDNGNGTYSATYTSGTTSGSVTITPKLSGVNFTNTSSITLTAGAATAAAITRSPSASATSGSALTIQPVIRVVDTNGNTVTGFTSNVVASIASGSGTLTGTTTVAAISGVATFTNLVISGTAGEFTLRFTPTSLTYIDASSITLFAAAASELLVTRNSAGAVSGAAFTTQPQVTIRDSYANIVNSSATVTATISLGATLVGTTTATASNGVATFSNLGVSGIAGTEYTVTYRITDPSIITTTELITPTASEKAALASLAINLGIMSPAFNTDTLNYSVSVSSAVSSISFTPTFTSTYATGTFNGSALTNGAVQTYSPTSGTNAPFNIVVTAQDGITTKTYQITVTKVITTVTTTSTKPTSPKPTPTPSPTKATTQPIKVPTVSLAPKITSLSTTTGAAGSSVIITGTNLSTTTSVRLSGKTAVIVSRSDTQLEVTVPSGASSGVFSLFTPKGSASSVKFTVTS